MREVAANASIGRIARGVSIQRAPGASALAQVGPPKRERFAYLRMFSLASDLPVIPVASNSAVECERL
jgi:hypothetical protein